MTFIKVKEKYSGSWKSYDLFLLPTHFHPLINDNFISIHNSLIEISNSVERLNLNRESRTYM